MSTLFKHYSHLPFKFNFCNFNKMFFRLENKIKFLQNYKHTHTLYIYTKKKKGRNKIFFCLLYVINIKK